MSAMDCWGGWGDPQEEPRVAAKVEERLQRGDCARVVGRKREQERDSAAPNCFVNSAVPLVAAIASASLLSAR
jgi:hypothetical protein